MTNPVRSITIEFERMPGMPRPVTLAFWRGTINPSIIVPFMDGTFGFTAIATCHPDDAFSWEVGMRLCVNRIGNPVLYRAFRRWMWLAKAAHECDNRRCCISCPLILNDPFVCTDGDDMSIDTPSKKIAREFGRVEVRVE